MIKIVGIKIANYRSFKDRDNEIKELNFINIIVGKNNVGKTNVLRAIYLFFNPESYSEVVDRNMIKQLTGGATKDPKLQIEFEDDELLENETCKYIVVCDLNRNYYYSITASDKRIKEKFNDSIKISK